MLALMASHSGFSIGGKMKEISLTKGYVALVDDEDYEELSKHKWRVCKMRGGPKAQRQSRRDASGKRTSVYMHRQITNAPPGLVVDHLNHDTLDNQRANLRVCTCAQNGANMRKRPGLSSRFKGVSWYALCGKWRASITVNGRFKHLSLFDDEVEAARAYNRAAREHFKEFALLNDV